MNFVHLILAVVARVAFYLLEPVLVLYSIAKRMVFPNKPLDWYFFQVALSIDQHANVVGMDILDDLLLINEDNGLAFGNEDYTISYVLAFNQRANNLTWFGRFWCWFLDTVDKDHMKKALENNEQDGNAG